MATAPGRSAGAAGGGAEPGSFTTDPELWREQQRFYNFLQHYDLHKYHQRFLRMGVRKLTHFKDVTDADLDAVGLTPPEKTRLRKKLDENFSTAGKIKKAIAGKAKVFDRDPTSEKFIQQSEATDSAPQEATLIAKEDIKLEKKLGEGAHGTVFEGTWSNKHGSVVVAVKTLYGKEEVHSTFIKEAQSMRSLLHQHIIQLYGIVLSSPLMLVQELAPLGDLHTYLKKHGAGKNVGLFHGYATQIADAMKYLEAKRIVHRDLATRNILLAAEDFDHFLDMTCTIES
jgi:activated CDC42 kinase 1